MSEIREKLSISWKYFSRFTKHRVFRLHPFLVVFRGISLSFLLLLGKSKVTSIKYGSQQFKFNFVPRGRNQGGRGLFLYREQIEPLMEFGHRLLKEGDVVLDGGASYSEIYDLLGNIGYKSYLLDAVGRLESITSLQADEDNVFFLRENHLTNFQV
jgi:hypothetical protein